VTWGQPHKASLPISPTVAYFRHHLSPFLHSSAPQRPAALPIGKAFRLIPAILLPNAQPRSVTLAADNSDINLQLPTGALKMLLYNSVAFGRKDTSQSNDGEISLLITWMFP
jgi:hypothetical protein